MARGMTLLSLQILLQIVAESTAAGARPADEHACRSGCSTAARRSS